ncbi:hypothetical protein CANARDRAFT_22921 [[Candida] arabinofermentans NRRL YB-2248]|uniref:Uncharacterized protein n=1 Tax=[Candida] arabinofermentans NRRL YB-2248 TaxID=983967 RepID=A0A1E4T0W2_9ASCO|nr:hypothetical protein CANARDRAFT_22921 [[Candida] arabinofermentans NRRL YB-2248]
MSTDTLNTPTSSSLLTNDENSPKSENSSQFETSTTPIKSNLKLKLQSESNSQSQSSSLDESTCLKLGDFKINSNSENSNLILNYKSPSDKFKLSPISSQLINSYKCKKNLYLNNKLSSTKLDSKLDTCADSNIDTCADTCADSNIGSKSDDFKDALVVGSLRYKLQLLSLEKA